MATCSKCGKNLKHVQYVQPNYSGEFGAFEPRPYLCKECWRKAVRKAEGKLGS